MDTGRHDVIWHHRGAVESRVKSNHLVRWVHSRRHDAELFQRCGHLTAAADHVCPPANQGTGRPRHPAARCRRVSADDLLVLQAGATFRLAMRPDPFAERVLGLLGSVMVGGYLVEREFRAAMKPSGWNRAVTPVGAAGAGLAAVMAGLGLRPRRNP